VVIRVEEWRPTRDEGDQVPGEEERNYRVGLGVVTLEGLFQDSIFEALSASWTTGATVTRYRRKWTLSKIHNLTPEAIVGQIGFVGENEVTTLFFDYDTGDFVRGGAPSGVLVPFAIRLSDGLVAYQLRPGMVREESFSGALAALLNTTANEYVWKVEAAVELRSWDEWRREVDSVTSFAFRLDKPNPHYDDDLLVEHLIEDLQLQYARLAGKALDEHGVNTDDDFFRQALDHVLREYGRAAVEGQTADGRDSTWVKVKGMAASVMARLTVGAIGGEEIPEEELVSVLQREQVGRDRMDVGLLEGELDDEP
jgi:hypothetical protein